MSARVRQPPRPGGLRLPDQPELAGRADGPLISQYAPAWQTPPPDWPPGSSVNEWACQWWLTEDQGLVQGEDFDRQIAVEAIGLFTGKPFTRIDFLFRIGAGRRASAPGDFDYLAWDPITPYTHPDPNEDWEKRRVLAANDHPNRTWLVWIDPVVLDWPDAVLPQALLGVDLSMRAKGW